MGLIKFALGIAAEILLLPFRNKRLQRKARPAGKCPEKRQAQNNNESKSFFKLNVLIC